MSEDTPDQPLTMRRGYVAEYSGDCAEGAWLRIVPEGVDLEAFVGHDIVFAAAPPRKEVRP